MVNINVIGRLAADAELKTSQKGHQFIQFRMGVNDFSEGKQTTSWFSVISSTDQAVRLQKFLTKGKPIHVMGTETLRLFQTKSGETAISRDINAYSIDFVATARKEDESNGSSTTSSTTTASPTLLEQTKINIPQVATATAATTSSTTPEDDLPF